MARTGIGRAERRSRLGGRTYSTALGYLDALVCPGFCGVWISGFWCLTPGGTDGTTGLPGGVSTQVLDLLAEGRSVAGIAHDLDISDQTIHNWRRQHRIDRGLQPGRITRENAELAAAKRQISELETELAISRRATELLKEATSPKGGTRPSR
jgi:transposase